MTSADRAKASAIQQMEIFLRNFSKVPDDRLNWSPTPTSKSALRIAAHTALYAGRFAKMIREKQLPQPSDLDQWLAENTEEERAITTREEVEAIFRSGTLEVIEAIDGLSQEDLDSTLEAGHGGAFTMDHLIHLPGWHATVHLGQIDFLQTCWDDQTVYID
ncbi:MAG: DinB family protein [Armatimonadetes bacterium]|nr:DinB family protein [Armatimonadota bacterium]